jgi:chromosomal replication initiation ATPase DnaA
VNCSIAQLSILTTADVRPLWPAGQEPSRKTAQRLCDLAAIATASAFALPLAELTVATRGAPDAAFARQSAMYLAHVAFGLSFSAIGRAFGRDRTTAAHACRLVEDRREDPAVDAVLASLESACASLRRRLAGAVRP